MAAARSVGLARKYPCVNCPIRKLPIFRQFSPEELAFVDTFKAGELTVEPRSTILVEGASSPHLYTVLLGWAFRYKMLPDGRRQILNYALPGEFLGLQATMLTEMSHSVEALTDVMLCVFPRERLWDLFKNHPTLSFDVTWLASRQEQMLDQNLLTIGRRNAIERTAYLILHLYTRARDLGMVDGKAFSPPVTQQHVADTLGLSIVHTNKTLRRLSERKAIRWKGRYLELLDMKVLADIAKWDDIADPVRPLI